MVNWSLYIDEEEFFSIGEDMDDSMQIALASAICGVKSITTSDLLLGYIADISTGCILWGSRELMSIYKDLKNHEEYLALDSIFSFEDRLEWDRIEKIDRSAYSFILSYHRDKIFKCTIKGDVPIRIDNTILFYERSLRILSTKQNQIQLVLCKLTPSSNQKCGNFRIILDHSSFYFKARRAPIYWMKRPSVVLSRREQWIIQLTSQGLCECDIAEVLHISLSRLKSIKGKMFCKMKVKNMCQAQRRAFLYQMLKCEFSQKSDCSQ